MLTPFTELNEVDYGALGAMVEWYIEQGVDGLFAVCQSSEMYHLTLQERVQIARFVKQKAGHHVPVVASGHISDGMQEQISELKAMVDTGIDALVWVSNHLAAQEKLVTRSKDTEGFTSLHRLQVRQLYDLTEEIVIKLFKEKVQ